MHGDARVRFCTHCDQKVYNLSEMSQEDASAFMAEQTGRVCVRYFQRADGTVLTSDCGRVERTKVRVKAAAVTAFTLLGLAAKFNGNAPSQPASPIVGEIPVQYGPTTGSVDYPHLSKPDPEGKAKPPRKLG